MTAFEVKYTALRATRVPPSGRVCHPLGVFFGVLMPEGPSPADTLPFLTNQERELYCTQSLIVDPTAILIVPHNRCTFGATVPDLGVANYAASKYRDRG